MKEHFGPAIRLTLVLTVVTGLMYPAVITGIAQAVFAKQANGSLVERKGHVAGSALIGQVFTKAEYFHSRPSAAGEGYDATASGGSNLGPTSAKLMERVKGSVAAYRAENPEAGETVAQDAATASASGLDPHITLANAEAQTARVAKARGVAAERVREVAREFTEGRDLGFLGEPRINVLRLNLALDERLPLGR